MLAALGAVAMVVVVMVWGAVAVAVQATAV